MTRLLDSPGTINIADLRQLARHRLPDVVFDYLDGASEGELTLRDNVACFEGPMWDADSFLMARIYIYIYIYRQIIQTYI